jgi:NAD(P)-dependent dehydrogenase (short-subunit alcohol dehydrogenase family)
VNRGLCVLTGAASGIGYELAHQLAHQGYDMAICDVDSDGLRIAAEEIRGTHPGRLVIDQTCDVSKRSQVESFRSKVGESSNNAPVTLLVNNAGIVGGTSFFKDSENQWNQTFDVTWGGVYNCCRVFLPSILSAKQSTIVNISSANGYWASSGHLTPMSAYSTTKIAVKGFTESLLVDSRVNAPHVRPILVMLGAVSTKLALHSQKYLGIKLPEDMTDHEIEMARERLVEPMKSLPVDELRLALQVSIAGDNSNAPTTPIEAATSIVDAINGDDWRVVIGPGAKILDEGVRHDPGQAYEHDFFRNLLSKRDALLKSE